jgi:Nickel responsive protein SCO4226-like
MNGEKGLRLFMVEHNLQGLLPQQLASAHRALAEAARREALRGGQIRYVQRIVVPEDGRCLCLFLAPSIDMVRAVNDTAQFPLARVVTVTSTARCDHGLTAEDDQ